MMRKVMFFVLVSFINFSGFTQVEEVLTYEEYLGYVKKYHPLVKQANLKINEGQARLMQARGAFDPKLEAEFDRKKFKSTTYYDKLNTTFKIPTWFGIEFKGSFEDNSGYYLNSESSIPAGGLYNVGVSVPLAKGLLINKRMAMFQKAKLFQKQTYAEQQLAVNTILRDASMAYFKWLKAYREWLLYTSFLSNAKVRFEGVKKNFELGEYAAIDTLEAGIILNNRKLSFEKARITLLKSSLEVSNYLWLENDIPVELEELVRPDIHTFQNVDAILKTTPLDMESAVIEKHPKLQILDLKYKRQQIDRRLYVNNLLPQIDLEYNFLTETPELVNSFNTANYKSGVRLSFPLFLRKERADLQLSKLKLSDTEFVLASTKVGLQNKLNAIRNELASYEKQQALTRDIVQDYTALLQAEERKFTLGESSLFLINARESKLIEAELKAIDMENEFLNAKASFFELVNPLL